MANINPGFCADRYWTIQRGAGPVIATAIHDGHDLRRAIADAMLLPEADRLREEDPFTGQAVTGVSTHIVVHRSRFEFDLNREAGTAVYEVPAQSWGLKVWKASLPQDLTAHSLAIHASYYRALENLLDDIATEHERFVLIDVHSYNHRRDGPQGAPMPQQRAPDVNIGTFSMPRERWAFLIDPLIEAMRQFDFNGRHLDVRENIAFQGKGEQARFVHERYTGRGCAIALEFKKFFMDEWTGQAEQAELDAMRRFIEFTAAQSSRLLQ